MPSVIAAGTVSASASTVVTPTNLTPGLPGTRSNGDWMLLITECTKPTATFSTPSGWNVVYDVTGTNGRFGLLSRKVDGAETTPTVTWSTLTTGAAGTPCVARIFNMGTGFYDIAGVLQVDVQGVVSNQAASTTIMAGGAGITTVTNGCYVFAQGIFLDEVLTGLTDAGTGITWTGLQGSQVVSGQGAIFAWSWGTKSPAGVIGAHTWTLTGASSFASSGVMVALKPEPPPVDTVPAPLMLTRSPIRLRGTG